MAIRRWRHGLGVFWRAPGESQIGIDPRVATIVGGMDADEQLLLDRLPVAGGEPELAGWAHQHGIGRRTVRRLLERVADAGALHEALPGTGASADARYWEVAEVAGHARPTDRRRSSVAVRGMDEVGLRVAVVLARAGVGRVVADDDGVVRDTDVAPGGYELGDIGRGRRTAATTALRRASPTVTVTPGPTAPDVVVISGHGTTDPATVRDLVSDDVVHLPIVARELDVVVGPLVRPEGGPCVHCLNLHRVDADPRWPAVATQLLARPPAGVETSLAWLAAGLAAHQVLAVLDGRASLLEASTLEVSATYPVPRRRVWEVHPRCGCTSRTLAAAVTPTA